MDRIVDSAAVSEQLIGALVADRSGRLSARALIRAIGWERGRRVTIDVVDGAVLVVSAPGGRHAVGGRGELVLPAAARQLCGINPHQPVLLAAYPVSSMVVVHSTLSANV